MKKYNYIIKYFSTFFFYITNINTFVSRETIKTLKYFKYIDILTIRLYVSRETLI